MPVPSLSLRQRFSRALHRSGSLRKVKHHLEAAPTLLGKGFGQRREWSQHGEDHLLTELLAPVIGDGYYVDVGANHPTRRSNTYRLYCQGMRGITVEPNLELQTLLRQYRPEDIHVPAGVGIVPGLQVFHEFNYHVFSTYSEEEARRTLEDPNALGAELVRSEPMPVYTLPQIIESCRPPDRTQFALLSVDTEGTDLEVLRSNHWDQYRPLFVIAEANTEGQALALSEAMKEWGYAQVESFGVNLLFEDNYANIAPIPRLTEEQHHFPAFSRQRGIQPQPT